MGLKRSIQLWLAKWLATPEIPEGKTTGYSLVRSEKSNCSFGKKAYAVAPFLLQNVVVGDSTYFARNALAANLSVGNFCSIGPNFCCGLGLHPTHGVSTHPDFYKANYEEHILTRIGNDVFIGANVTVLDGVTIGDGAVIGAGAVVTEDIPAYAVAVGVPARVVKYRFDEDTIQKFLSIKWWEWSEEDLKKVQAKEFDIKGFIQTQKL